MFSEINCIVVGQSVYQWIVKPQTAMKTNEMFLPGRMAFIFNMVSSIFFFCSRSILACSV